MCCVAKELCADQMVNDDSNCNSIVGVASGRAVKGVLKRKRVVQGKLDR